MPCLMQAQELICQCTRNSRFRFAVRSTPVSDLVSFSPPLTRNTAHLWHRCPLLKIDFHGRISAWETDEGSALLIPLPCDLSLEPHVESVSER